MTDKTEQSPELEALDPTPETVTLESGLEVRFEEMRTIQLFALMRILSRGTGALFGSIRLNPNSTREEFLVQFLALLGAAVPEADTETIEFLKSMTKPEDLQLPDKGKRLTPAQQEFNAELWDKYQADFENPSIGDLLTLIEAIVRREAADIQSLGKRVMAMVSLARRAGNLPTSIFSDGSSATTQTDSSED